MESFVLPAPLLDVRSLFHPPSRDDPRLGCEGREREMAEEKRGGAGMAILSAAAAERGRFLKLIQFSSFFSSTWPLLRSVSTAGAPRTKSAIPAAFTHGGFPACSRFFSRAQSEASTQIEEPRGEEGGEAEEGTGRGWLSEET